MFISPDTALALKKMYLAMTESCMFGPSKQHTMIDQS